MTELGVLQIIEAEQALREIFEDSTPTDFDSPRWEEVDKATIQSCFDKGFVTWTDDILSLTDLGRRTCGV